MTLARLRFAVAAALAASPGSFACGGAVAPEPLPSASSGSSSSSSSGGSSSSSSSSSSGNPPAGCVVTLPPDAPTAPCGFDAQISGDPRACGFATDGFQASSVCKAYCGGSVECAWYAVSPDRLTCGNGCEGRRPAGLGGRVLRYLDELAEYFARAAYLEAASVPAFAFLHEELVLHGAPRGLAARALSARADEVRHARLMGWLARRLGVTPEAPAALRRKPRALLDMAIENAVEGCVRETWGALLAAYQAQRSTHAPVRRVMAVIAREELEHAQLGHEVAAWLERKLTRSQRRRVQVARLFAIVELREQVAVAPSARLQSFAGFPDAPRALAMFDALFAELGPKASAFAIPGAGARAGRAPARIERALRRSA